MRRQLGEGCKSDVLSSRHNSLETLDVPVKVLMVDEVDEFAPEDAIHVFQIRDHPCFRIDRPGDGHLDHVVVAVIAGAGAEDLPVPSLIPLRTAEDMGRGEGRPASNSNCRGAHPANSSPRTPARVNPLDGDVTDSRAA
jgi:hypothetical protein